MFHALCAAIFVLLSGSICGMDIEIKSKTSEEEFALNTMTFHDWVLYRIKNGTQNHRGMFDVTLLFCACSLGYLEDIKLLLDAHAEANVKTFAGVTPLHVVSQGGHIEAVKLLLAAGANISMKNDHGDTPLQLAQQKGHTEIVTLIQEQSKRDAVDKKKAHLIKRSTW